jgi:hypothetical protein
MLLAMTWRSRGGLIVAGFFWASSGSGIDAYRMMLAEYEAEEERAGAQCTEVGVEV